MSAPYGPPPAYPPYPAYPQTYPVYPPTYGPPYPYYGMPAPPRPFPYSARQIAAFVLSLTGLVLTSAALLSGWWSLSASMGGVGFSSTVTISYGLFGPGFSGIGGAILPFEAPVANVFTFTAVMVGVALLLAIFPVILAFLASRPWARWAGVGLAIASGALLILAPLYLMAALPGPMWASLGTAITPGGSFSGFWGVAVIDSGGGWTVQLSWGAGIGWYLSFTAGAVLFVGSVLLAIPPRAPMPNPVAAGSAPAPAVPDPGTPQMPPTAESSPPIAPGT